MLGTKSIFLREILVDKIAQNLLDTRIVWVKIKQLHMNPFTYLVKIIKQHPEGMIVQQPLDEDFLLKATADEGTNPAGSSVHAQITMQPINGDQILAQIALEGVLEQRCQRCLERAKIPIDAAFSLHFVSRQAQEMAEESDDPDAPEVIFYDSKEGSIDLTLAIRDQLILALPMAVFCKESCLGLCPTCGENRNVISCGCPAQPSFSPFAKLKTHIAKN